jgi:putative membrane protein
MGVPSRGALMTSFRWFVAAASLAVLLFGLPPAHAQDKKAGGLSQEDARSLARMARGDMAEIAAGKVAAEKASHPEVRKFGEQMVQDHGKMLEEGRKLAQAKGLKPPAAPARKHQEALKKLQGLSGDEFDRRYMQQMVKDHDEASKLAEKTAKEAKDAELKAHAQKGAPHIKEHLAMARKLNDSLRAGAGKSKK